MNALYYKSGKDAFGHYIEATTENEFGDIIQCKRVYYPLVEYRQGQKLFFLQYNDKMELVYDVCRYLNYYIKGSSDKTRRLKAEIIRRYLCFMSLSGFDHSDLSDAYVVERVTSFFRGDDYRSADTSTSQRSRSTINCYLGVIRDFARFLNKKSPITEYVKNQSAANEPDGMSYAAKTYPSSLRNNPHANDFIKQYISPEEFLTLRRLALARNDSQAIILMHLMFFYGLRIGECLGLTEEDFEIRQKQFAPSPTILLRNRLSDRPFQYVKRVFHPQSERDYQTRSYPHQKVLISLPFYEKIMSFIENTSKNLEEKGLRERSIADTISTTHKRGNNHYIFVNIHGRPLSKNAWNLRLRDYFTAAMIPVDNDVRKNNLNHRFRHGCAMYYLRFAEEGHRMTVEQVADLLRHDSLSSVYNYLKITLDDEFMLKQKFQDSLLNDIPIL